jgi:antitoxin component HigA of HigAB toxin-antitoxin module
MTGFDEQRYAELLASARPRVIETPEEHDRMLTIAEELMDKGEAMSPEERKLLELLVLLVKVFDELVFEEEVEEDQAEEHAPLPRPHETLQRLIHARGWESSVLVDVFGNPHLVSQVLSGLRPITKGQAKALAKIFDVPVKLFLA